MIEDEVKGLFKQADDARRDGRLDDAEQLLDEAAKLSIDDWTLYGDGLCKRAQIRRDRGDRADAIALYEMAITFYQHDGVPRSVADCLRHLGDVQRETGDFIKAETHLLSALATYNRFATCAPLVLANTYRPLALLNEAMGKPEEARDYWIEALELYQQAGVEAGVEECQAHLDGYSPSQ